jgi:hypothetical protein
MSLVPIYDARKVDGDFVTILKKIDSLPIFAGEVPAGSCVVVGYTINTFMRSDDSVKSLSYNIHWVIVLGIQK